MSDDCEKNTVDTMKILLYHHHLSPHAHKHTHTHTHTHTQTHTRTQTRLHRLTTASVDAAIHQTSEICPFTWTEHCIHHQKHESMQPLTQLNAARTSFGSARTHTHTLAGSHALMMRERWMLATARSNITGEPRSPAPRSQTAPSQAGAAWRPPHR